MKFEFYPDILLTQRYFEWMKCEILKKNITLLALKRQQLLTIFFLIYFSSHHSSSSRLVVYNHCRKQLFLKLLETSQEKISCKSFIVKNSTVAFAFCRYSGNIWKSYLKAIFHCLKLPWLVSDNLN